MRPADFELRAQNPRALAILPVSTNMVMFATSTPGTSEVPRGSPSRWIHNFRHAQQSNQCQLKLIANLMPIVYFLPQKYYMLEYDA